MLGVTRPEEFSLAPAERKSCEAEIFSRRRCPRHPPELTLFFFADGLDDRFGNRYGVEFLVFIVFFNFDVQAGLRQLGGLGHVRSNFGFDLVGDFRMIAQEIFGVLAALAELPSLYGRTRRACR